MIENDKLVRKTRSCSDEYKAPVYKTEVVITKEEFLECFNAWVVKPSQKNSASVEPGFYIPVDNGGVTPV